MRAIDVGALEVGAAEPGDDEPRDREVLRVRVPPRAKTEWGARERLGMSARKAFARVPANAVRLRAR